MNGYICYCFKNHQQTEVYAADLISAKDLAVEKFRALHRKIKIKDSDVTCDLCEKDGTPVVHTPDF